MFNNKKDSTSTGSKVAGLIGGTPKHTLTALLDAGTAFEGRLTFSGTIHINGKFTGEISGNDHLVILDKGTVNGEIEVGTLEIAGEVTGQVRVREKIIITSTGRFRGELEAPAGSLEIHNGANFEGTCRMGATTSGTSRLTLAAAEPSRGK